MKQFTLYIILLFSFINGISQVSQNRFIPGEKLKFVIYYGLVTGGYIDSELILTEYEGKKVYHSKMLARTTGIANALLPLTTVGGTAIVGCGTGCGVVGITTTAPWLLRQLLSSSVIVQPHSPLAWRAQIALL